MDIDKKKRERIRSRNEPFVERTATQIWQEIPSADNPYLAESQRCYGYDVLALIEQHSLVEVMFLLLVGELPSTEQTTLFETTLTALINPGPRHMATRAAMNAGVGKTDPAHILPIALSVLGGQHLGGHEVSAAMRFLRKHHRKDPVAVANQCLLDNSSETHVEGDTRVAPGFGTLYGGIDPFAETIAQLLTALPARTDTLAWGNHFVAVARPQGSGWLLPGVAAAAFVDLGFHSLAGAGLFQLACAPGLLAHGLELASKPRTAMPFLDDTQYFVES